MISQNKNKFLSLLDFSGKYKLLTIVGCILSAISAICQLIPFLYIWKFVQAIFMVFPNVSSAQNLEEYAVIAFIFAVLGVLLNFAALMCTHVSAFRNERNMKNKAIEHILKLPLGYFSNHTSGGLRKIIDFSTSTTETFLAHQLPDFVGAIVTPIVFLILLFSINWILGLVCLIPIIIGFLLLIPMMGGKNQSAMRLYQNSLEEMNSEAVEYVRGIPVTKTFQQTLFSFKNFYKSIKNYGKFVRQFSFSCQLPMTTFTLSINGFFAFLIPAGILLSGSLINTDLLLDFIFYIILTPVCTVMLNKIMMVSQDWMTASQALDKINEILNEKPLIESKNPKTPSNNSIKFENVYFDYDKKQDETHILNNINLEINEGETIALVGPSGGGKTTIASLIPRFWDVQDGKISIGGVDVKDILHKDLMDIISFVFQNTQLFKDSIFNNVAIGKKGSSKEDVLNALKLAQCGDILDKLPDGIDTVIGKKGIYLSGGEQQRISLARAILKDANIIILDEATALADPENELQIQKAIKEITKNKTVLMIAHRLSTIQNVDKIFVIDNGQIVEKGSHLELINQKGFYYNMWMEYKESVQWKVKHDFNKYLSIGGV